MSSKWITIRMLQKYINGLLIHTKHAQYFTCQRNFLHRTCVFCTYIVWCQLIHLYECWRRYMAYYRPNAITLNVFLTHQLVYRDTLWHNCTNVIIFPDGKLFTSIMLYINIVRYYWRVICSDREFILSVNFIIHIYLKDYQ